MLFSFDKQLIFIFLYSNFINLTKTLKKFIFKLKKFEKNNFEIFFVRSYSLKTCVSMLYLLMISFNSSSSPNDGLYSSFTLRLFVTVIYLSINFSSFSISNFLFNSFCFVSAIFFLFLYNV